MDRGSYKAEEYVLVVGGVNIDIGGQPFGRLEPKTSNPGVIRTALGGVGRNIAHNLSLLGKKVIFLTAFGDDIYAGQIEGSCARLGIDISHARIVPGGKTSAYLFLNDEQGDMETAVSDMQICEQITPAYLEENLSLIENAAVIAADTNIPEESLAYLTEHADAPVFVDPVSVAKAEKLRGVLSRIHTLKPNLTEAAALTRVSITGKECSTKPIASFENVCPLYHKIREKQTNFFACEPPVPIYFAELWYNTNLALKRANSRASFPF